MTFIAISAKKGDDLRGRIAGGRRLTPGEA